MILPAKYYKLPLCEGLEALQVSNHKTAFPAHFHPTYNISLIYDGTFRTQLSDQLLHAPSGTILVTNPQEIHANPCEKEERISFFTFYISQRFLEHANQYRPVVFNQKVINDFQLFSALHRLSQNINQVNTAASWEPDLKDALGLMAQRYGSADYQPESVRIQTLFDDFLAEDNLSKFSLADAARRFGVDKYKFLRLFKFQTGLTPNNYFILQRIEKSKLMLSAGRDLLSIAIELGFYDVAHYCNHFKKFTGVSPMSYTAAG